ncbi:phosphate acyltransferase PlsX [candidate division GN15 bacterium]|nr:phosphate acyltransferase PlsX [candidate division GN15 bacterium]
MTAANTYTIVLDVMGADRGPATIIQGGIEAAQAVGDRLRVVLVGDEDVIQSALDELEEVPDNVDVKHAEQTVPMEMGATEGARMRKSSVAVGIGLVKKGTADAFVSPGNTGAVMATSLLTLGRIAGVSRPAITSTFPTSTGKPCIVLDVGANADCKPQHLSQFAVMGSVYAQVSRRVASPRVGLISIGEERSKGNELIFSARELLKDSQINFVGNIEGRDILSGVVDVAVTDGFTGNILLKFAESIQPMLVSAIKRQIQTNIFSRFGVMMMLPFMRRMRNTFDYAQWGGAPLLGVNGIVVICHGSSSARAITNAVTGAYRMAHQGITERLRDELITNHFGTENGSSKTKGEDIGDGVVYTTAPDDQR